MAQPKRKKDNYEELVKLIRQISPVNLQRLLEFAIGEFMEVELDEKIGAKSYERREGRNNYRNGYRVRKEPLKTGLGDLWIKIPKLRAGSYYPSILEHYNRIDRALVTVICEAYYAGVSTRKMEDIFHQIGMANIDRNVVSRCAQEIDEQVKKWKERTLDDNYVYIWLDAVYTRVREEGAVVSTAVLIATALREDGHRDILGFHLGNKESFYNWKVFLQSLKERGLQHSELWISDDHEGLNKALMECFPGQLHQRCLVHWMRNTLGKVQKSEHSWLIPLLKSVVNASTEEMFNFAWRHLLIVAEVKGKYKLREWLEESYDEISTYLNFPPEHWMKIKCTNVLERLNEELRRRERCIRIFPNENSCNRLMGDILQKYSEEWTSGRIYLTNPLEKIRAYREEKESGNLDPGVLEPCSASSAGLQNITDRELNEKDIDNKSKFNKQYNRSQNLKYKVKVKL